MENPNQILELMKMKTPDMKKNMSKYSCFDKYHGHHTGAFYKLKEEIKKKLIQRGHLRQFMEREFNEAHLDKRKRHVGRSS